MINITHEQNDFILRIPKSFLEEQFIQRFLERLHFLELVQKSELTEDAAWKLSEEVKSAWWVQNKKRILDKLEEA